MLSHNLIKSVNLESSQTYLPENIACGSFGTVPKVIECLETLVEIIQTDLVDNQAG